MSKKWELDKEALEELLFWLDPDPERAGQKYETIRAGLVKVLIHRKCSAPEEVADEIINRVAMKVPGIRDTYKGDPASYFYGVAKHIFLEHQRKTQKLEPFDDRLHNIRRAEPTGELAYECMDSCMKKLTPANRELVRRYFEESGPEQRESLAKSLGITKNALAVRVFRVMQSLKKCFVKCMQEGNL
jgi:RNA polymerase sigma factor (sigma-70 family)